MQHWDTVQVKTEVTFHSFAIWVERVNVPATGVSVNSPYMFVQPGAVSLTHLSILRKDLGQFLAQL